MKKTFEPIEDIKALKDDELTAQSDLALEEYGELVKIADDEITDEQLDRIDELKAGIAAIKAERTERETAAEARAERIKAAKETPAEDEEPGDEQPGDEEPGDEEAAAEKEKEDALVASGRARTVAAAASKAKRPAPKPEDEDAARSAKITQITDTRQFGAGQALTMDEMVESFTARLKGMPRGRVGSAVNKYGVAQIAKPGDARYDEFAITDRTTSEDAWRNIMAASKESNLGTGANALIAAGGWCAPSENFYDLCAWETATGALDLPTITVTRGGINFTKGPEFADIYADSGFTQTEQNAIDGVEKPFLEVECPEWEEVRLDAIGYGVKAPILTASPAGFPELIRRYLEGTLVAHYHRSNAYVINKVVAGLGAVQNFAELGSGTGDLLYSIEIAAQSLRYKYRLGENATLEAMFPMWIKSAIRADLAYRTGVDMLGVTDAQIQSWFTLRGIRPQYVYDWSGQDLVGTELAFPSSVRFGIWPAGTFVKGENSVISLDAIYDSTEIATNTYTAAFFEEAILVANTCGEGRLFEVGLNYFGLTGAAQVGGIATS